MKQTSLKIDLSTEELQEMVDRYHINDADLFLVEILYQAMRPLLQASLYYEMREGNDKDVIIVVTLGKYLDLLQNLYSEAGAILESYLVECLGMLLLEKGYRLAEEIIEQDIGYSIADFYFPDSEEPKDSGMPGLKEIIDSFGRSGMTSVIYNEAGMLIPKKSVTFCATLCEGEEKKTKSICDQCENLNCENRKMSNEPPRRDSKKLNYGYQKIFGDKANKTNKIKEKQEF